MDARIFFWRFMWLALAQRFFRLVTYRKGKLLFFKDFAHRKSNETNDEFEERYKNNSLKAATVCFIASIVMFFVWVICEFIIFAVTANIV
jgi:hypothetical protein